MQSIGTRIRIPHPAPVALLRINRKIAGQEGKNFVVLITYRPHCESTVVFFKRVRPYFGVDLHIVTCPTMDDDECDLTISAFPDMLKEAYQLGVTVAM